VRFLNKQSSKKVDTIKNKLDIPEPWQISFQDPATPGMEGIIDLHHEIMFYLVVIITFVL
jgi:hypothetical protein